ncbi:MAG: helix-turn-helix transcriptional regulator [Cyclobacteriaceae bacterium]|nr:helix-turn-helix transcriptional regulator [Cyclobacteriaceae bacterium]MCH8516196.1 helix-turn-helix transcriptional regulator [Cyclobacteriaceae bacterium]
MKRKIVIIIEKTDTGFSAYSDDFAIFTTAKSIQDLIENTLEATNLYFEEQGREIQIDDLKFEIDFKQFFQFYKLINSNFLAHKIGMNPTLLSQYVQGHKKPSQKQIEKIINGIQQIGKELAEINLIYKN